MEFHDDGRVAGAPRGGGARRLRLRPWIPLFLVFWLGVWAIESLAGDVSAAGFATVDPRRSKLECSPDVADARWQDVLRRSLAVLPPIAAHDPRALASVSAQLAALPFVAEVGDVRVCWPDALEVPVRLRVPAACVQVRDEFMMVSEDGVVLPGGTATRPWVAHGFLPVIGPHAIEHDRLRAGQRLTAPSDLDALSVAISMRANLCRTDFETMGPPLIDATRARLASVSEPGVRLELDAERVVWFGRSPRAGEPGELPAEMKWASLARALAEVRQNQHDWSVVDVRWDVPAISWRSAAGE